MKDNRAWQRTGKLNNKGVSLIELLVAMTILSIIAVTIFHGLVLGAKTNAKARKQHQATSLAQNILEGLKAEDINTILSQFSQPALTDGDGNVLAVQFDILPDSLLQDASGSSINWNTSVGTLASNAVVPQAERVGYLYLTPPVSSVKQYVDTSDGKYYLYLKNLRMENTLFDALITLDGTPYIKKEGSTPVEEDYNKNVFKGKAYNSEKIMQAPNMDVNYDAIIANCDIYDTYAYNYADGKYGVNFDQTKLSRKITVDIKEEPLLSGKKADIVSVTYSYFYTHEGSKEILSEAEQTDYVFDNRENADNELRNVFLFYQPLYKWLGNSCTNPDKDVITINNTDKRKTDLYLVKQQVTDNMSELGIWENNYRMGFNVNEDVLAVTTDPAALQLRTNLDVNMATGVTVNQVQYWYGSDYKMGTALIGDQAAEKYQIRGITNEQSVDKLMNVTIEVYLAGEETVFTGPADFKAKVGEKKAEITGSIRN